LNNNNILTAILPQPVRTTHPTIAAGAIAPAGAFVLDAGIAAMTANAGQALLDL